MNSVKISLATYGVSKGQKMEKTKPVVKEKEEQEKFRGFDDDILDAEDFEEETDKEEEQPVGEEGDNDADDNPDEDDKGEESKQTDEEKAKKQSKEENARYAEARRQAEEKARLAKEQEAEKAKIKEQARIEAELGLIKKNPYTDAPIEDEEDLEIYKVQKAIEDAGGDPLNDLAKKLAEIARDKKRAEKERLDAEAKKKAEDDAYIANDIAELRKAYPDVNLAELARDIDYQEFIKGKIKRWTSTELYEGYLASKTKVAKKKAEDDEEEVISKSGKQITKVPSPQPQGKLSTKNIDEMSDEEYLKNEKAKSVDFFS